METQIPEAFRYIPYGIYVLTTKRGTDLYRMIVSWVSQVSYSPPLLAVALRRNRRALPAILESGLFSLSLLKKNQKPLVSRFKDSPPGPDFSIFLEENGKRALPSFEGCLASWECRLTSSVEAGDHILCIGEVQSASLQGGEDPLTTLDYGKTYIGQF
ncbi:MAG TPA: flavin reductase family protein [Thermodesulfobacteriota bacterium]|nr:flavin reductase family protein [Thermodesulfobacteriota bacterium]